MPDEPKSSTGDQSKEAGKETIAIDSLLLTRLKNYLMREVLPYLDELPDYEDSLEFRDKVLSTWIETCIGQGLEEEGYFKRKRLLDKDEIGESPFGDVAIKC